MDDDFLLAIQLQEQFDNEYETSLFASSGFQGNDFGQSNKKRKVEVTGGDGDVVPCWKPSIQPERPLSIVDESWEVLDPSPDVRAMFLEFNDMFFWGKLSGVEVKWSPRMTLCAGVCSYEGRGGLCSIRLSEPLLKLRPRKDLVETLLHEMIHALLFVTQNNRDRDGHGPEFCKHMNRINKASGTNISIYHSFHDEVDVYRQHWWRCNGPCQNRRPYFGYVKRAMNRAPSSLDPWWEDHQRTCGGTYTKIKEPEGYGKKSKKGDKNNVKTSEKSTSRSEKHTGSGSQDIRNIIPFSGKGFILGVKSLSSASSSPSHKPPVPVVKTSPPSPLSSPKKLLTPSSPAKSLSSPACSGLDHPTKATSTSFPSIRTATSTGQKPPIKRSVSNTRVFVNTNGSPVRIPKAHSSNSSHGVERVKQRSIQDLFNSTDLRKSVSGPSVSNPNTKKDLLTSPKTPTSVSSFFPKHQSSSSPSTSNASSNKSTNSKHPSLVSSKNSSAKPTQSRFFTNSDSELEAAGEGQRKRPWNDHSSSASIFDFFQKKSDSDSAASRESKKTKPPAVQQRTACATSSSSSSPSTPPLLSSAGPHSGTTSSSSSSSALMVSCPVCQAKVQESKINEHLDSCLS
ncbi:DNA-dependent metalloprotease SPRTN [Mastacembelus armatus]|uniref:DNA-dependent metalloprotease SPRTN n=1 Tax=Mastacembelus armatus TaxID=205130 RepID=UPI000E45D107|nr:sprT-like domain-containing protein Spartan [Mastacembelus armatus]